MNARFFAGARGGLTLALYLCAALVATDAAAQQPDFTGVWTTYRPPAGAAGAGGGGGGRGRGAGPGLPLTDEAKQKIARYRALVGPTSDTPGGYCLGTGMPGSMLGSGAYPMEIIQRPEQITIIYEAHGEIRRVYFGDRAMPEADRIPSRNGHSVGRWEGDTLVVETTNLVEQVDQQYAHSDQARIIERYRLEKDSAGQKVLVAEMTLIDPVFYTKPVTATKRWSHVPNGYMLPYECAEEFWQNRLEELEQKAAPAK